jgi:hypothetical protein
MKILLSILLICGPVFASDDFQTIFKNSQDSVRQAQKGISDLEGRIKEIETSGLYSRSQLKKMEEQNVGIYGKLKAKRQELVTAIEKKAQLEQREDTNTLIRAQLLVSNFDMAANDSNAIMERLHTLDRMYDQTNLGLYLKDKMLQFAGTKQACEIAESCKDPKKRAEKANSINDVFPGGKSGSNDSTSAAGQR